MRSDDKGEMLLPEVQDVYMDDDDGYYTGPVLNDVPHGKGIMVYKNGQGEVITRVRRLLNHNFL